MGDFEVAAGGVGVGGLATRCEYRAVLTFTTWFEFATRLKHLKTRFQYKQRV